MTDRTCLLCGIAKPNSAFEYRSDRAQFRNQCKVCRRQQPGRKESRAKLERERRKDPIRKAKNKARRAVNAAIVRGALARQPCSVCGDSSAEAHHDDYSKPLDVRWLCPHHHRQHHLSVGPREIAA